MNMHLMYNSRNLIRVALEIHDRKLIAKKRCVYHYSHDALLEIFYLQTKMKYSRN